MKYFLTIVFICIGPALALAQNTCPADKVCLDHDTANRYYKLADEYIALKDAYNKMLAERGASDAVVASYKKLVADYEQAMTIRDNIDARKDALIALYEKTIQMYADLVAKLENKINAPKSAWQKFVQTLREIGLLAAGVALGRGL